MFCYFNAREKAVFQLEKKNSKKRVLRLFSAEWKAKLNSFKVNEKKAF